MDLLTQEQFVARLTHSCRYDKLIKPETADPLKIYIQLDVRHIETIEQLVRFLRKLNTECFINYDRKDKVLKTKLGIKLFVFTASYTFKYNFIIITLIRKSKLILRLFFVVFRCTKL